MLRQAHRTNGQTVMAAEFIQVHETRAEEESYTVEWNLVECARPIAAHTIR